MTEVGRILLTTAATVLGGVAVFVFGQLVSRFFIEPVYEQRKTIGAIADTLLFFENLLADSTDAPTGAVAETAARFRQLASEDGKPRGTGSRRRSY